MDNDIKSSGLADKQAALQRLKDSKVLYVLMSACTKSPYVFCNPETFDDEVFLFVNPEDAQAEVKRLLEEKIPVSAAKLENNQLLLFYTNLFTMGVNALLIKESGKEQLIQLEELVKRRADDLEAEGKIWVENPALHLTTLYYMQEARRQPGPEMDLRLQELQEEIEVNFRKGSFILAIQKEGNGIPLVKLKSGDVYQAAFTDVLEFQKFNREDKLRPVMVSADKIAEVLVKEANGVILNPMGVNIPLAVNKGPK